MSVDTKAIINPNTGQVKSVFNVEREPLLCPICGIEAEYLVGDDIGDGRRGCEACWRSPTVKANPAGGPVPIVIKPGDKLPADNTPAISPPAPDQLADFDKEVRQEYGRPSPAMPGIVSSPSAGDNDFERFKQDLADKARGMDGGDTHG